MNLIQAALLAAVNSGNRKTWHILLPTFQFGSNTGARRGEILGLKWDKVYFDESKVQICNNVLYRADRGIYEDTPKTSTSGRFIALPEETMQLLRQYRAWQNEERLRLGEYYSYQGFVFSQDNGKPMYLDSVTAWLSKFSKRHGLPMSIRMLSATQWPLCSTSTAWTAFPSQSGLDIPK